MNVLEIAFKKLFPYSKKEYSFNTIYSGRLKDFNANIELRGAVMTLKISRRFYSVDENIQVGIVQELLCRLFKAKKRTIEMDLYDNFIKSLHLSIPKTKTNPLLEESFNRVNKKYFLELVEIPNLVWSKESKNVMGSYNFRNDTLSISKTLFDAPEYLIDYVMFHELLHKQRKFERKGLKTSYHDSKFKNAEKIFSHEGKNSEDIEKDLQKYVRKHKIKNFFGF